MRRAFSIVSEIQSSGRMHKKTLLSYTKRNLESAFVKLCLLNLHKNIEKRVKICYYLAMWDKNIKT